MAKSEMLGKIGRAAFLVGVLLALIFGFLSGGSWLAGFLVLIGIIVGFLNISEKEVGAFLTAGTVLVLMGYFGGQTLTTVAYVGAFLQNVFSNIVLLFVPATIVVAVKSVYALAKD